MVLEAVANTILEFVNLGVTILVIMLVVEIWKFFTFETKAGEHLEKKASSLFNWAQKGVQKKNPFSSEGRKARTTEGDAQSEKTKLLNEYIEEKKEEELLENSNTETDVFKRIFIDFEAGVANINQLKASFGKLKKSVEDAVKEISRLKRSTFRQERQSQKLIKELEDAEVSKTDLQKAKVLENDILEKHEEVIKSMKIVKTSLQEISNELTKNTAALKVNTRNVDAALIKGQDNLKLALSDQLKAYKDAQALVAFFQKTWKP